MAGFFWFFVPAITGFFAGMPAIELGWHAHEGVILAGFLDWHPSYQGTQT
ncbi:MAG: hypothetical protein P4L87_16725 [Formivibrio sp.]|nr:hypothetical protein [Formivibrio sp.]